MAQRIDVARTVLSDGRLRARLLFSFTLDETVDGTPLGGRIKDGSNNDVIPAWNKADIPAVFQGKLPAAMLNLFDSGDAGFVAHEMTQRHGEDVPALTAAVWADYDVRVPAEVARRRAQAALTGQYEVLYSTLTR